MRLVTYCQCVSKLKILNVNVNEKVYGLDDGENGVKHIKRHVQGAMSEQTLVIFFSCKNVYKKCAKNVLKNGSC